MSLKFSNVYRYDNDLLKIVELVPQYFKDTECKGLSRNPLCCNKIRKMIKDHDYKIDGIWCNDDIFSSYYIEYDYIEEWIIEKMNDWRATKKWIWNAISENGEGIDMKFYEKYKSKINHHLFSRTVSDVNIVEKYQNEDWDYERMINVDITPELYKKHKDTLFSDTFQRENSIFDSKMAEKVIMENPEMSEHHFIKFSNRVSTEFLIEMKDRNFRDMNFRGVKTCPVSYIEKHISENWNWHKLTVHMDIDVILANLHLPWLWGQIHLNKGCVRKESVLKDFSRKQWEELSFKPYVDDDFVEKYIDKPWSLSMLGMNVGITVKTAEKFKLKDEFIEGFSCNPNLTFEFFKENMNLKWDYNGIASNYFQADPRMKIKEKLKNRQTMVFNILEKIIGKDLSGEITKYVNWK